MQATERYVSENDGLDARTDMVMYLCEGFIYGSMRCVKKREMNRGISLPTTQRHC